MSKTDRVPAVISDANVLIDYISVERTKVLRLVAEHLFAIKIPRSILEEVNDLSEDQAEALGMEVIDGSLIQIQEASYRGGALSQPDKLCFVIARDNQWAIWTSDKPLHTKCEQENIPVYWGLELMIELTKRELITPEYAIETAERIEQVNQRISVGILNHFTQLFYKREKILHIT
ncbi:MAG: hypothetical protein PF904_21050 [Kiritimatiellae bacterium]|jgi:rRNA-processing protein FCF1|nr:hypothetical protein [Kiritimatiellia bacterium]